MYKLVTTTPMPTLNKKSNPSRYYCKPFDYKRHIETSIEKVYKYLNDREKRRKEEHENYTKCYKSTAEYGDHETIENLIANRESLYLRSLRSPIRISDFQIIKPLGSGYIGKVFLVKKLVDSKRHNEPLYYAMKKITKSPLYLNDRVAENTAHIMAERDILAEADNEWIVKLYYSFQDEFHLYFILEYTPGGDMMGWLQRKNQFTEDQARFYIAEISLAVQFVHDKGFIHRDIKPDNILVDRQGHIKLTDFGLCTSRRWTHDPRFYKDDTCNSINYEIQRPNGAINHRDHPTITEALARREIDHSNRQRTLSVVGSPNYIAPEVLKQAMSLDEPNLPYDRLCDWWSVGVILYEMLIGYAPFIDVQQVLRGNYNPNEDTPEKIQKRILDYKMHLHLPREVLSDEAKGLIEGLLTDRAFRLCKHGISDLQSHPFFAGVEWQDIRQQEAPFKHEIDRIENDLDTRYFDDIAPASDFDSLGNSVGLPMHDFTYKCF